MKSIIVQTPEMFFEAMSYLEQSDTVYFDLETNSAEEIKATVYGIGFCIDDTKAYYVPIRDKHGELWFDTLTGEVVETMKRMLADKKIIGHNVIYDVLVWNRNFNQDLTDNIVSDTILLKHTLDEERPFSLKETAVKYLGDWADKAQKTMIENIKANGGSVTKTNLEMYKCDTEILGEYCCWDVLLSCKLHDLFIAKLEEQGLQDLYFEEVMPLYREVTIPMKRKGVEIDTSLFKNKQAKIHKDIHLIEDQVIVALQDKIEPFQSALLNESFPVNNKGNFPKKYYEVSGRGTLAALNQKVLKTLPDDEFKEFVTTGDANLLDPATIVQTQLTMFFEKHDDQNYVFNLKSKAHLKWLFFEAMDEKPLSFTDGGAPQVDDDFLSSIAHKHAWVKDLQNFNVLNKMNGTYYQGILDRVVDGNLYTSFLQFGTTSGRFSSSNPNLQNWPAPQNEGNITDEYVNAIRNGIRARLGYKFIGSDFSSLEPHIAAYVSGDPDLIDIFVTGKDFYSAIAIKQFKLAHLSAFKDDKNYLGNVDKALRNKTKTYSLAAFYGATAPRISQVLKCDVEEAEELLEGYLDAFPGIRKFINKAHNDAVTKGYVSTIYGRKRRLETAKRIHQAYGYDVLNWRWAKKNNKSEERKILKNLLNNAVNFQIQGAAGHVMNKAMINTARLFKENGIDGQIVMTIHDEQLCEVREDQVELATGIIKFAMETAVDLSPIKLKATPIVGTTYGECK